MRPSKDEVLHELGFFMEEFSKSVQRMYGDAVQFSSAKAFQSSHLWRAVEAACDFGLHGIESQLTHAEGGVYEELADAELFVTAMCTPQMELYLQEDEGSPPSKVLLAIQLAVARIVLEGGSRYTDLYTLDGGPPAFDCLTIREIALLADMDERSVRNAANPAAANPLKTISVGKRTMVEVEEARRWLAGRKGFVPTRREGEPAKEPATETLRIDAALAERLKAQAAASGLSLDELVAKLIEQPKKIIVKKGAK